jgi:hypothetical protein
LRGRGLGRTARVHQVRLVVIEQSQGGDTPQQITPVGSIDDAIAASREP